MIQKSFQLNFSYTATAKRFITYIYHMSCFILIYFDKFTHFDRWFLCRQSKFVTRLILWRYRINCMKKTKVSTKYLQVRRGAQHCSLYLLSEYIGSQFLVIGYFWLKTLFKYCGGTMFGNSYQNKAWKKIQTFSVAIQLKFPFTLYQDLKETSGEWEDPHKKKWSE